MRFSCRVYNFSVLKFSLVKCTKHEFSSVDYTLTDHKMAGYSNNSHAIIVPMGISWQDSYFHRQKGLQLLMTGDVFFSGIIIEPFIMMKTSQW